MAVVFRSHSDMVYLPDHGFVGEEGALRILPQITRQIHRLDISHNLLSDAGVLFLCRGLTTLRTRYSEYQASFPPSDIPGTSEGGWEITEANFGVNSLSDEGLEGLLKFAKLGGLRKLWVQGNEITLSSNIEGTILLLNDTKLSNLSLVNNPRLHPPSLKKLFRALNLPTLNELHLSTCGIPQSLARYIASFISSPRSRNLSVLELNGNKLGLPGVRLMIDAIEHHNFSIARVELLANDEGVPNNDMERLSYEVHERLPKLLERNRSLTRRVRKAAINIVAPARIILNARRPTDEESARGIIHRVGNRMTGQHAFPFLDLPEEVIFHIVRWATGDASALSERQFRKLREEVVREGSLRAACEMRGKLGKRFDDEGDRVDWECKQAWLGLGGCDRWEVDRAVDEEEFVESEEEEVEEAIGEEDDLDQEEQVRGDS